MSLFQITSNEVSGGTTNIDANLTIALIDKYAQSNDQPDIKSWRHDLFLPDSIVRGAINDLEQIKESITLIMNGNAIMQVIDEEIIYNTPPIDVNELNQILFDLVVRDYELKKSGDYPYTDVELKNITEYIVDQFIKYSDGSGTANFSTFMELITQ